jgi:hypothetical protein
LVVVFVLDWGHHVDRGVASATVEAFLDPAADGDLGFGLGGPGPSVVELGLQGGPERFGCGVVPTDPGPADRLQQSQIAAQRGDLR